MATLTSVCIRGTKVHRLGGEGTHFLRFPLPFEGGAAATLSAAGGEAEGSRLTLLRLGGMSSAEIEEVTGCGEALLCEREQCR